MSIKCFVNSVSQVSCQSPLSGEWIENPRIVSEDYVRALEPDTKKYIPAGAARRMSKILARAVCTSFNALEKAGVQVPDAIITGTGKGCMENSENFLHDLNTFGESCLKPSLFMQSTHNTISSQIAILLKTHGYNNTFSHKGISFESALFDAYIQIRTGNFKNALVGSHDEVTPLMSKIIRCNHPEYGFISETSMSTVLSDQESERNICEVADVTILHRPDPERFEEILHRHKDSIFMLGTNGNRLNDTPYHRLLEAVKYDGVTLQYKHLFGDNFSSSALGFYVAATLLETGEVPPSLYSGNLPAVHLPVTDITIINHTETTDWSVIRLKR